MLVDNYVQPDFGIQSTDSITFGQSRKKILLLNDIKQKINRQHEKLSTSSDN